MVTLVFKGFYTDIKKHLKKNYLFSSVRFKIYFKTVQKDLKIYNFFY